jgi:hypothetical protein
MLLNVYYSRMSSSRYVFPDGSEAAFIGGRYTTDDKNKIAHLDTEIKKGNPHIFIDPSLVQMEASDLDPMEVIKKRIIAEAIASGEIQRTSSSSDYKQEALKPSSSSDLMDVKTAEESALGINAGEQVSLAKEMTAKISDVKTILKK